MAKESLNPDSNDFNKIVNRQIDLFYDDVSQTIRVDFEDLPENSFIDKETLKEIMADAWDSLEMDDSVDILKYCVYYTGLVGKFYKTNVILSLENICSILGDLLKSSDFDIFLQKLYRFSSFILIDVCQKSVSDICFVLDCHTDTLEYCDNSGRMIFLHDLPNKEERTLIFHITVISSRIDEYKLTSCGISSNLKPETEDRVSCQNNENKYSKSLKSTSSSEQSDTSTNLSSDSKSIDPWQQYGAKPKDKRYLKKKSSDQTKNPKEDRLDSYKSPHDADQRLSDDYRRARNRSYFSENFERMNKVMDEKVSEKCSLSFPPQPIMENVKPIIKSISTDIENKLDPRQSRDYSLPSCSNEPSTKHFVSPSKNTGYFKRLIAEEASIRYSPNKSDSVPCTKTPGHDLYCKRFGAKIDEHGNRRCCNIDDKRKNHKANEILQGLHSPSEIFKDVDLVSIPDFSQVDLGNVFKSEKQKAELPEELREIQKAYEQAVINMMVKSESELVAPSLCAEVQRDENLPMQAIAPKSEKEATEIQYIRSPQMELDFRAFLIKYHCDNFFENYRDIVYLDNMPSLNFPPNFFNEINVSGFSDQEAASSHDDPTSDHLIVKTSDNEVSVNWELLRSNKVSSNLEKSVQGVLHRTSEKTGRGSTTNVSIGRMCDSCGETCDPALLTYIQQTGTPSAQISSHCSESMQPSTHTDDASETPSEYLEDLELTHPIDIDVDVDETDLPYVSDVSDSEECDSLGSVSEIDDETS